MQPQKTFIYFTILVKLSSIFKQSVLQLSVLAAVRPWTASSLADRGRNEGRGASGGGGGGTLDGAPPLSFQPCAMPTADKHSTTWRTGVCRI